jgi:hypothetical protein
LFGQIFIINGTHDLAKGGVPELGVAATIILQPIGLPITFERN